MKITSVEPVLCERVPLLVRMETDAGIIGVGECLPDQGATTAARVRELGRYLVGKDPCRIEHHWQAMYRDAFWRGGPVLTAAISGCEHAMWDIFGRSVGLPVYKLLGGACRERVRMYGHIGGETPEELARSCEEALGRGLTAVKFCPTEQVKNLDSPAVVKQAGAKMKAVREAAGDEVEVLIDMHGRLSPAMAIEIAEELAPHRPFFLEEPCLPENVEAMAWVARAVKTPIATGERLFTKFGFREVLEKQAAAVVQPDPSVCGGILEAKKIAAMAEAYYVSVAPHCPYGAVLLTVCLHLDTCTPNFLMQEFTDLGEGTLREPLEMEDGYCTAPEKPGWGIEVDWEALAQRPYKPRERPTFRHDDGSVADW
jgi:galactonate dehydratase